MYGSTALLVNLIFAVGLNLTRLAGAMQSTSRAICAARPRTVDVEHELLTAVPTLIADDVSPYSGGSTHAATASAAITSVVCKQAASLRRANLSQRMRTAFPPHRR